VQRRDKNATAREVLSKWAGEPKKKLQLGPVEGDEGTCRILNVKGVEWVPHSLRHAALFPREKRLRGRREGDFQRKVSKALYLYSDIFVQRKCARGEKRGLPGKGKLSDRSPENLKRRKKNKSGRKDLFYCPTRKKGKLRDQASL